MNKILSLLLILFLMSTVAFSYPRHLHQLIQSTCKVKTFDGDKVLCSGTAFVISNKNGWVTLLTCEHVVKPEQEPPFFVFDENKINLKIEINGKDFRAYCIKCDHERDLSLLMCKHSYIKPILLSRANQTNLRIGTVVTSVGCPRGEPEIVVEGKIACEHPRIYHSMKHEIIFLDISCAGGNSGGPILNENGEVVGVLEIGLRESNIMGMIDLKEIRAFLAAN